MSRDKSGKETNCLQDVTRISGEPYVVLLQYITQGCFLPNFRRVIMEPSHGRSEISRFTPKCIEDKLTLTQLNLFHTENVSWDQAAQATTKRTNRTEVFRAVLNNASS